MPACRTEARPILVTGASGFLGEHLARTLADAGTSVLAGYRSHPVPIAGASVVPCDLADPAAVERLLTGHRPRVIVHCAALTDVADCERHPDRAERDIVTATSNLARTVARFDASIPLAAISTDLVFDGTGAPYREEDPPSPISVYGTCKARAEQAVLGLPGGLVLRAALLYGAPTVHRRSFLGWMVDTLRAGAELGLFQDEFRTPIWVDDLTTAIVRLLDAGARGLWHAGGPDRLDRLSMGQLVSAVFGFDQGLLIPRHLADSDYAAPRPADVSLDSSRLWQHINHRPAPFAKAVAQLAHAFNPATKKGG